MAGMSVNVVLLILFLFLPLRVWQSAKAQTTFIGDRSNFTFVNRFGNAEIIPDVGIRLIDQTEYVTGSAFYAQPVRMKNSGSVNEILSFSTTFVFAIIPPPDVTKTSGHGMVFIITPNESQKNVLAGQYLGLFDHLTSIGRPENHLFGIEFDTVQNQEYGDINDNHVGVDLNSLSSVESKYAGYWVGNQFVDLDMKSGQNIQAWIDYDHVQKQLKVAIAPAGCLRPEKPLISMKNMNLSGILEENMYVGFSAGTGLLIEAPYILAWSFSTNGTAPVLDTSRLPSLSHSKPKSKKLQLIAGVATALVVLLFLSATAAALVWFKRKKQADVIEEWEVDYWPHRFRYRDLHTATKGFGEEQVIGRGGFGEVYKGVLAANGLEVAVKCILRETREGLKEFVAEISSLGRLQHRNLVPIRGYCRRGKQLFIVYDYMPNGSLDKMIFENPWRVLEWGHRYKILKDVAAGLVYLHEEWEQRVVHRDIKSSNVLLDSELRGKVGDFGLARLYAHDEKSQTTRVAGTPGYIAPELARTGKATPRTDVFSFGVLMLEVGCGRRPVNPFPDGDQMVLFDWVLLLYANGRLMDAADPRLGGEFDENEMEIALKLGVICCNPEPETRPDIRQVLQILEGGDSIPGFELQLLFEDDMNTPITVENGSFSSVDAFCSVSLEEAE